MNHLCEVTLRPASGSQKATGTDDRPIAGDSAYKPAYKKLTKTTDFDGLTLSSIGDTEAPKIAVSVNQQDIGKSLEVTGLGNKKSHMSSSDSGPVNTGRCRARLPWAFSPAKLIIIQKLMAESRSLKA